MLDCPFVPAVAVSPANPQLIYAATNDHPYHDNSLAEGILSSADGGATWRHENTGLPHRNVRSISVDPLDPSVLYLGTGGNGAFVGKEDRVR